MTSAVEIASQASVLIGGAVITSFTGTSAEAIVASALYETTARDLLSRHRWRFASGQVQLNRLVEVPVARWDAAYQLPTEPAVLVINAVTVVDQDIPFDRYEDNIYCNAAIADVVVLDYTYRAAETLWPPYFCTALRYVLAGQLASAIPAKAELSQFWFERADEARSNAAVRDSQGRTARRLFRGSRFLTVRRPRGA